MPRFSYPHTIDNGAGERLTWARRIETPDGDRLEGNNVVAPGSGPPMHVHHYQTESFTVAQGKLGYQTLGGPEKFAGVGQSVTFPKGIPHRFWNAGTEDLRCNATLEPADNIEYFLGEVFASVKRSGEGRPSIFDMAWLATRYRSEYAFFMVPQPVQRVLFPVVIALGNALGKYKRFEDAPEPVRR